MRFISRSSDVIGEKLRGYCITADCYGMLKDYKKAIPYYKYLMSENEISLSECLSLAECEIKEKRYDDAKQTMDRAITLAETETEKMFSIFSHVMMLQDVNQFERAKVELDYIVNFFKRVKTTDPTRMVLLIGDFGPNLFEVLNQALPTIQSWGKQKALSWLDDIAANTDDEGKEIVVEIKKKIK